MSLAVIAKAQRLKKQRDTLRLKRITKVEGSTTPPLSYEAALSSLPMPPKLRPIFKGESRYRCAYGGRGSGKSHTFALMLAVRGLYQPLRILCAREIQDSIKESVLKDIVRAIESISWLRSHYEIGESYIRGKNGTEFIFKGLWRNFTAIKSMSGINICWVEEAEYVSQESWDILRPTIREKGSEIWATWNPEDEQSSTRSQFVLHPPQRIRITEINWRDNPFFSDELEEERVHCQEVMPERYDHIWEGQCIDTENSPQSIVPRTYFDAARAKYDNDPNYWEQYKLRYPPRYGLDVGDGGDAHALAEWHGNLLTFTEEKEGLGDMEDVDRAADWLESYLKGNGGAIGLVDQIGVGAGALSKLIRKGYGVGPFRWGNRANEPLNYLNQKAEQFWALREAMREGKIAIAPLGKYEDDLRKELAGIYYQQDSKGAIRIEPKEMTRARLKKSPNLADAVVGGFRRAVMEVVARESKSDRRVSSRRTGLRMP